MTEPGTRRREPPRPADADGPLTTGRIYRVTEVRTRMTHAGNHVEWVPVLGPFHDDAEIIGFESRHWHVDYRFVSGRLAQGMEHRRQLTQARHSLHPAFNLVITRVCPAGLKAPSLDGLRVDGDDKLTNEDTGETLKAPRATWLREANRRCKRAYPAYAHRDVPWLEELRRTYRDRRLLPGRVCPHRGAPLAGLEPDGQSNVVCPLHGLAWNLRTGRMAPAPG